MPFSCQFFPSCLCGLTSFQKESQDCIIFRDYISIPHPPKVGQDTVAFSVLCECNNMIHHPKISCHLESCCISNEPFLYRPVYKESSLHGHGKTPTFLNIFETGLYFSEVLESG